MKKNLLPTLLALFTAAPLFGQDLIVKRDNEKIEARMVAITDSVVTYRLFSDTISDDGPVYSIDKAAVRTILWENGDQDDFGETKKVPIPRAQRPKFDYSTLSGELSIRDNHRVYTIGNTLLTRRQVVEYMESYPEVLRQIKAGYHMKRAAIALKSVGGAITFIGLVGLAVGMEDADYSGLGVMLVGGAIAGTGIGLGIASKNKQTRAMQLYNEHYADYSATPGREVRLSLAPTSGGLGLQLNF